MTSLDFRETAGKAVGAPARPELADRGPSKGPLGYPFTAVPQSLWDAIAAHQALPPPDPKLSQAERWKITNDRLKLMDAAVMAVLCNFAWRVRASCWCTNEKIAEKLGGVDLGTVKRSLRRLALYGFIQRVRVPKPDPDEPKNRTGWRFILLFVPGAKPQVVTQPITDQCVHGGLWSPGALEPRVIGAPSTGGSGAPQVSARALRTEGLESEGETPPSSSSLGAPTESPQIPDDDDICRSREGTLETPGQAAAIAAAAACFGADVARQVEADAGRIAGKLGGRWDCYAAAIELAGVNPGKVTRPLGYFLATARDFAANGISAEARAAHERFQARQRAERERAMAKTADPPPEPLPVDEEIRQLEALLASAPHPIQRGVYERQLAKLRGSAT
jgi:hypothetical protein